MREAASPRETAKAFSLPEHHIRRWIREGRIVPRAVGRRSLVLFAEVRDVIAAMPPVKSSRRLINEQREADHVRTELR
jgi:hypothetical protein